jgi:hypothetical protein
MSMTKHAGLRDGRRASSLIEVLVGLAIALSICCLLMSFAGRTERLRAGGDGVVRASSDGHQLDVLVQEKPARFFETKVDMPVRRVGYRFNARSGTVTRLDMGAGRPLPLEGLKSLAFSIQRGEGPEARDLLWARGTIQPSRAVPEHRFALAFPFGNRKPGRVTWNSMLD